ncbi:MAG: sugar transferase [Caldilineales bacterium]|nr:sugar transferase [Caldilineales bacterium]
MRRRGIGAKRVLLVGAGETSRHIMRVLLVTATWAMMSSVSGRRPGTRSQRNLGPSHGLGPIENLPQVLNEDHVDEVIITLPWHYHRRIIGVLTQCERQAVRARVVPDVLQMSLDRVDVEVLDGIPLLGVKYVAIAGSRFAVKRAIDLVLATLITLLLAPLMAILIVLIKLDSPGPAFFVHERVGKNGVLFRTFKFRSMVVEAEALRPQLAALNEADGPLFKIRDDPRATRVGRYLRRFSLDELPQLFNVLRGEMSLVGPRPALPDEVAAYESWQRKRLEVMPGITGLWQISGRSDLGFEEMMLLDIYYVENWSPLLDVSIMLRTIPKVLLRHGAY